MDSLDSCIQAALSSLFPPFDLTAPVVLSQLFRTIDERYHGDALHCLLDFLIPAKHVLESIQQAACAGYCAVVFRCEGWPLCLHDQTVIQLAPVNPLLLRPGDFYLQVTPFGEQAARIVLKSLLEEGCREVEETPIPEASYPMIFTLEWLQDINEGRQGAPLTRCVLCTDQGIVKLPWDKIAIPEFLDKPKNIPIMPPVSQEPEPNNRVTQHPRFNSSTLPLEMHHASKHKMSASLRHPSYSSRVIKPDRKSKAHAKPVGWVSPNTWDRPSEKEMEGDYVDLVEVAKQRERLDKSERKLHPGLIKAVRPPQPRLGTQCLTAMLQYSENPFLPCGDFGISDEELRSRYRESYTAALKNPVPLEKGNSLSSLEEFRCLEEMKVLSVCTKDSVEEEVGVGASLNHCKEELCQFKEFCEPANVKFASHLKDLKKASENAASMCTLDIATKEHFLTECGAKGFMNDLVDWSERKTEVMKGSTKRKAKMRSLSAVSEASKGSLLLENRSRSDDCPEVIHSLVQTENTEEVEREAEREETLESPQNESQVICGASERADQPPPQPCPPVLSEPQPCPPVISEPDPAVPSAPPPEGALSAITPLLTLGLLCLPGSRDRTGRAVVEVHGDREEWSHPLVSAHSLCKLLLYLYTIPRREVSELGLTLVINSRKRAAPPSLYQALLLAQEQALHTVHSILLFVEKDNSPRPEKLTGLQMDVVSSLKALCKSVEVAQVTTELGGTFVYSHHDWILLHQRIVSFMSDLKEADHLLQSAIQKVEGAQKLDTVQEVERCMEQQRALMLEVLRDPRLMTLQREGGSVLARVRKDQPRFPHSHDYRDWLEMASLLYNQVEEELHALVMKSNQSLQRLDSVLTLRQADNCVNQTGTWLGSEAEQLLKDSWPSEETLCAAERALQHFTNIISQAKEKQESSSTLVKNAVQILQSTSEPSAATDVQQTIFSTFQSNLADFMVRAERRHKELEILVQVYSFCEKACGFAEECSVFLASSPPDACLQLSAYQDRLSDEFSTSRFQSLKSLLAPLAPAAAKAWNAAWERRQKLQQTLDEILKKRQKSPNQTSAAHQGSDGAKADGQNQNGEPTNVIDEVNDEGNVAQKPREHSSEADLSSCRAKLSCHKQLGRSLSEGSKFKGKLTLLPDFSPLNVREKLAKEESLRRKLSLPCVEGVRRDSHDAEGGDGPREHQQPPGTIPSQRLNSGTNMQRLRCIAEELLSTEREYVRSLGFVCEQYLPELDRPDVPQELRGQKGAVFSNLEKIRDFHTHHFLPELETCEEEPTRVGHCFLTHRDSFALYALYSKNKPVSDRLLIDHRTFFKQKQSALGDRMDLWSYLLKPVQRISKYSLLLQDVLRECGPDQQGALEEVRKALEVVQFQLRHGNNLLAMDAIQQCDVNLKEQGALIRQDEFLLTFRKRKCFRHVFLFQELVLFSKTRKTEVGNETYVYKQSFKTCDIGLTHNSGDSGLCFEIWFRKRKSQDTYTLQAESRSTKELWTKDLEKILWDQALRNKEVRMQERVFLGIGNKPFMDIQPSDAAINSRAVSCGLMGKESRPASISSIGSSGSRDVLPVMRQKSIGSCSSSSSSSSGRGSLSPGRYLLRPQGGAVEEDELEQDGHNLTLEGLEWCGDSVSDTSSLCSSVITVRHPESTPGKSTEV